MPLPNITDWIFFVTALLSICYTGYIDYKTRQIPNDWPFVVILVCSVLMGDVWPLKIIYLAVFSVFLYGTTLALEKLSNKEFVIIGGADIKLMLAIIFLVGPYHFFFAFVLSLILSMNFRKKKIAFCTAMSAGFILWTVIYYVITYWPV